MKKFILAIFAVFYLSTSIGATVHLHYCMGKLADWGFSHRDGSKCSNCGMEKNHASSNDGCCKDEFKQIKNDKDQKIAETAFNLIQVASVSVPTSFIEVLTVDISSIAEDYAVSNSPPRSRPDIYILNCVFRI